MPTTARLALPYPTPDDEPQGPAQIQALAEKIDQVVVVPNAGDLKFSALKNEHGAWIKADGRTLAVGVYPALRAALIADGSPYGATGGDPRLPDMRDRAPVGTGPTRAHGSSGGEATHTLTAAEMPAHNHGVNDPQHAHGLVTVGPGAAGSGVLDDRAPGDFYDVRNDLMNGAATGVTIQNAGGGSGHNNMPPYAVGQWFIYAGG